MGISNRSLLASFDYYSYPVGHNTYTQVGKRIQQDLHTWWHGIDHPKGFYRKDPNNAGNWWDFYPANHNPPASEKIVSLNKHSAGGSSQIWESNGNEILASLDSYNNGDNPAYLWWLGKIYQQNLHHWYHWSGQPKGFLGKDHSTWWYFYSAIRKNPPASEKIVSWYRHSGGSLYQMWESNGYEILASYDLYYYDNPEYAIHPGKRYQQSLHYWGHAYSRPKGSYGKDQYSASFFWWFYKANHKDPPASEKIVSLIRNGGGSGSQLWGSYYSLTEHLSNLMIRFEESYTITLYH